MIRYDGWKGGFKLLDKIGDENIIRLILTTWGR